MDEHKDALMEKLHLMNGPYLTNAVMLLLSKDPEKWQLGAYVKIGFPPKYQDPFIPEINIYIPSGVETLESQAIYLGIVQDEVMDQNVYINIYLEAGDVPASWPSDWYYVSKGTGPEFTCDKTVIRVYIGQAM